MKTMLHILEAQLQAGHPLVLAAIVDTSGSTARGPGAVMLTGKDGILWGTVGGGIAEHRAAQTARSMPENGAPRLQWFRVNENDTDNPGEIQVFFTGLSPADPTLPPLMEEIHRCIAADTALWLVLDLQHGKPGLSDSSGTVRGLDTRIPDWRPTPGAQRYRTADTDLLALPLHSRNPSQEKWNWQEN